MKRPEGIVDFEPDADLFPFESRWFASSVGPVHYVDEVIRLEAAGHYIQEDAPDQIIEAIGGTFGPTLGEPTT